MAFSDDIPARTVADFERDKARRFEEMCRSNEGRWEKLTRYPPRSREKSGRPRSRRVCCVQLGKHFDSAIEAGEWVGLSTKSIREAVRRGSCTGGYHWKWSDRLSNVTLKEPKSTPVVCRELGEFRSVAEAVIHLQSLGDKRNCQALHESIRRSCKRNKPVFGTSYKFTYIAGDKHAGNTSDVRHRGSAKGVKAEACAAA